MVANSLRMAVRYIRKAPFFFLVSVFGLVVGFTCCLLIFLYIFYETSYDNHHQNRDRIFQLVRTAATAEQEERTANIAAGMGRLLQADCPEIQQTTRALNLFTDDKTLMKYKPPSGIARSLNASNGYLADSNFFQIFTYRFREGHPANALIQPNSVVLSEEIATKLLGPGPALNKIIRISSNTNGEGDYRVTGVFKKTAAPSHIDARFFLSMGGGQMESYARRPGLAKNNLFYTYLLLKPGTDAARLEAALPALVRKYFPPGAADREIERGLSILPISKVHLAAGITNMTAPVSTAYLLKLFFIGIMILLIASINFMNLSTARSVRRAGEVGIRKTFGANQKDLILQFFTESYALTGVAFIASLVLVGLSLPLINHFTGKELGFALLQPPVWIGALLLQLLTGLFASAYPAVYLASFQPARILKGVHTNGFSAGLIRQGLVVLQFVIMTILLVAAFSIMSQRNFLQNEDLGFKKEQQLVVPLRTPQAKMAYTNLKKSFAQTADVAGVGGCLYYPGIFNPTDWRMRRASAAPSEAHTVYLNAVDTTFIQTLSLKLIAGRLFFSADTFFRMIVNETLVKKLGYGAAANAIGQRILYDLQGRHIWYEIVGVVQDFHFRDLHKEIEPFGFVLKNDGFNYLVAHARPGNLPSVIAQLQKAWKNQVPEEPFEYSFLNEDFQKNYLAEQRLSLQINCAAIISILLSSLGLVGFASFNIERRRKEISIRKALGAGNIHISLLLLREMMRLAVVALFLGLPPGLLVMEEWLGSFAYKVTIGRDVLMYSAVATMGIVIATTAIPVIRAAFSNPVRHLR